MKDFLLYKDYIGSVHFNSEDEMLKYSKEIIINNFRFDINNILKRSKLLENVKTQVKLNKWF